MVLETAESVDWGVGVDGTSNLDRTKIGWSVDGLTGTALIGIVGCRGNSAK
jgi:hypothetical protein